MYLIVMFTSRSSALIFIILIYLSNKDLTPNVKYLHFAIVHSVEEQRSRAT